jgi:hypothetical protein
VATSDSLSHTRGVFRDRSLYRIEFAGLRSYLRFGLDPSLLREVERIAIEFLSNRVRAAGEPFRLSFDPRALEADLRHLGFSEVEDCSGSVINNRYFANRADDFRVRGEAGHLLTAWV